MEVVRVGGFLEDSIAGGEEPENNHDSEVEDRKLVCMVRWIIKYCSFLHFYQICFSLCFNAVEFKLSLYSND